MARSLVCTMAGAASLLIASSIPSVTLAVPLQLQGAVPPAPSVIEQAQVGIYIGTERPYRPYRPYYEGYNRPYYPYRPYAYRPYYYAPPPVTYYETRPYVARPAGPYRDPDAVARCASRFRSFNVRTGTYVTLGGEVRLCPYLE